jgi:hypothetical protein
MVVPLTECMNMNKCIKGVKNCNKDDVKMFQSVAALNAVSAYRLKNIYSV